MVGIVADKNIEGHVNAILRILQGDAWRSLWDEMAVRVESFETLGLGADTPDDVLWHSCQSNELVLITGNRNEIGDDSLEATIRRENNARRLPVITLGQPDRALNDRAYQEKIAAGLLEYLLAIENYRGSGRLYLP